MIFQFLKQVFGIYKISFKRERSQVFLLWYKTQYMYFKEQRLHLWINILLFFKNVSVSSPDQDKDTWSGKTWSLKLVLLIYYDDIISLLHQKNNKNTKILAKIGVNIFVFVKYIPIFSENVLKERQQQFSVDIRHVARDLQ